MAMHGCAAVAAIQLGGAAFAVRFCLVIQEGLYLWIPLSCFLLLKLLIRCHPSLHDTVRLHSFAIDLFLAELRFLKVATSLVTIYTSLLSMKKPASYTRVKQPGTMCTIGSYCGAMIKPSMLLPGWCITWIFW